MKTITLNPTLPPADAADTTVVNLTTDSGHLTPVDRPVPHLTYSGSPVAIATADTLTTLFTIADGWLTAYTSGLPARQLFQCSPDAITSVLPLDRSVIFMLRDSSPVRIVWSDRSWHLASGFQLPSVHFSATTSIPISRRSISRTLSGDYTHWSGPLHSTDRANLSDDLTDAYYALIDTALITGRHCQPVIAWWRMLDHSGRLIHTSNPLIIGPHALQVTSPVSAVVTSESGKWRRLNGFTLNAHAYTPTATVSPSQWSGCKIEILVTPPVDLIAIALGSSTPDFAFGPSDTSQATLTASLPAADTDRVIAAMLDRLESISTVVASVGADADNPVSIRLTPDPAINARTSTARLMRAINTPVATIDPLVASCRPPHSFSAHASRADADTVVWGDITPIPAPPSSMSDAAVDWSENQQWAATTVITGHDNFQQSSTSSGSTICPRLLSPLVCYPLQSATSISMQFSSPLTNGRRTISIPLSPTPARRWAFAVGSTLSPVDPSEWPLSLQPIQPLFPDSLPSHPTSLIVAQATDPLQPIVSVSVAHGHIRAITPAARSSSAWDFARRHFYIFSTTAIHALSISRTAWSSSVSSILPVGIDHSDKVSVTDQAVIASCTDGIIRRIYGSRAAPYITHAGTVSSIAWSSATSSLWVLSNSPQQATVYNLDSPPRAATRSDIAPQRFLSDGSTLYIASQGNLSRIYPHDKAQFTYVAYVRRLQLPHHFLPRHVCWHITSSMARLTLDISADWGDSQRARSILTLSTAGPLRAPVTAALPAFPPCTHLTITIRGTVTPDTRIGPTTVATRCIAGTDVTCGI